MTRLVDLIQRWTVLAGSAGLAVAVGTLGAALKAQWLVIAAAAILVVGAGFELISALGAERRKEEKAAQERKALTRVPIAGVREVSPTSIGIDPAPPQRILPGGEVPRYLPREVDGQLDRAIEEGLAGTGRWIVIAIGSSKVGKSRAMFEALRRGSVTREITLVAPTSHAALLELLEPGHFPNRNGCSALWLDDLEPFVDAGLTLETLERWRGRFEPCVVIATFGGKGSSLVQGSDGEKLGTVAGEIRRRAREVFLGGTSEAEIEELPRVPSPDEMAAIKRHGLAAFLVAGPELAAKLGTQRRTPGEPKCPAGVAVLFAAVDWARAGRTDPIPAATLEELWGRYLPAGGHQTADGLEIGLEWALDPVAGTISLLEDVGGYRAYDYVVELVNERRAWQVHDESIWAAALADATDSQALSVGTTAFSRGRFEDAAVGFEIAVRSPNRPMAALAIVNYGVALGKMDRHEEEVAAYGKLIDGVDGDEEESLQVQVATALFNRGVALGELGRHEEAIASYDRAIVRYSKAEVPRAREQAASALLNKGVLLDEMGRSEEALVIYDLVLEQYRDRSELRRLIARAMVNRGSARARLGRLEEAIDVYDEVIDRFGDAEEIDVQEQVAAALVSHGNALVDLDREPDAAIFYEEVIRRFAGSDNPMLRRRVADSLFNKGSHLRALGLDHEALAAYDHLVRRFADSDDAVILDNVATALTNKAIMLGEQDRSEEAVVVLDAIIARLMRTGKPELRDRVANARFIKGVRLEALGRWEDSIASFRRVVDDYGDDEEMALRETVAESLLNLGACFSRKGRHEEAVAVYDDLLARFGEATERALRKQVAMSLVNKGLDLTKLDRKGEAVETFDMAIGRDDGAAEPELRMEVLAALINKGDTLVSMERVEEAHAAYEDAVARFGDDPDPAVREEAVNVVVRLAALRDKDEPPRGDPG